MDYRDARQRLGAIDAEIQALAPDGDPEPALQALIALGRSSCFAIGGRLDFPEPKTSHDGRPDSGYSLKAFWHDGGKDWIEGYLDLAVPVTTDHDRVLWTEPTFHKTLSRETDARSPLAPVLCSVRDEACVSATDAFRARFEARFAVFVAGQRLAEWRARVGDQGDAGLPMDLGSVLGHRERVPRETG